MRIVLTVLALAGSFGKEPNSVHFEGQAASQLIKIESAKEITFQNVHYEPVQNLPDYPAR